ncbi:MAG: tRNA lysidine(34) synthetase TilS [Mycoplasmatales bacterium]|nr:tRNA lysidine(34) synthetase TilS [Mycoplasmatales bacterium]
MKLLAVSGGPDSMFLLNWYKKKKIVVAHVNYNKRKDSKNDENIVKNFCKKNNIKLETLVVNEESSGNFQAWAREIRYSFFKKIYDKYNCDELLMGHHKDDFLETAIMQQQSGRFPRYFGIKKRNFINEMNIYRPFLFLYWKSEILKSLSGDGISYAIDSTNSKPIFERNKIRIELNKKTKKEKNDIFKWFKMSNKILVKKFKKVDFIYKRWKHSEYKIRNFREIKFKEEVIYEFINDNFQNVNLSSKKIENIVLFIDSPNGGKSFKLNDKHSLIKENGLVKFVHFEPPKII